MDTYQIATLHPSLPRLPFFDGDILQIGAVFQPLFARSAMIRFRDSFCARLSGPRSATVVSHRFFRFRLFKLILQLGSFAVRLAPKNFDMLRNLILIKDEI